MLESFLTLLVSSVALHGTKRNLVCVCLVVYFSFNMIGIDVHVHVPLKRVTPRNPALIDVMLKKLQNTRECLCN